MTRFVRNPAARIKRVGEKAAVYLRETGAVHVLNPTAELLFESLAEPASLDELVAVFEDLTDGDITAIRRDLSRTLVDFEKLGISSVA